MSTKDQRVEEMADGASTEGSLGRRDALKKAAAAGVVVWASPALLSSRVSAVDVCTPKCAPSNVVSFSGTATKIVCDSGAPGLQPVKWNIGTVSTGSATCACGGTATVVVEGGNIIDVEAKPGRQSATFPITATITCFDRAENALVKTCTGTGTLQESGNCNSQPFTTPYTGSFTCGTEVACIPKS